jgi:two-component system, NtrC family, nitrogen regulation sensor histidine kinase NtrY
MHCGIKRKKLSKGVFRRYPYWGWLLAIALLWSFAGYRYHENMLLLKPRAIANTVSEDIQYRERELNLFLEQEDLIRKMFAGTLTTSEVSELADASFHIYAFEDDVLIFWNNNTVIGTCRRDSLLKDNNSLFKSNGTFLKKCIQLPIIEENKSIVALFPISYNYPFENEYLKSHYAAADYIPSSTKVMTKREGNSYAVRDEKAHTLFFLQINEQELPRWISDPLLILLIIAAVLASLTWITLIAVALAKNGKHWKGLLLIVLSILLAKGAISVFGLPFSFGDTTLFSPQLYASSFLLPSLGDLIIDVLCILWLEIFLLSYIPLDGIKPPSNFILKYVIAAVVAVALSSAAFATADLIRSLVIDSRISFDVSHFNTVTVYTVIGLFTLALIACSTAFIVHILYAQLRNLVTTSWIRYLTLLLPAAIFLALNRTAGEGYYFYAAGWLFILIVLLDLPFLKKPLSFFAPNMIFWAAFIALFSTITLQYFNDKKEGATRRVFAERIVNQRDDVMEYLFADIAERMSKDKLLRGFLDSPIADTRSIVNEHLGTTYLRGQLNRYDARIYLFDKGGRFLFNSDTTRFEEFAAIANSSVPVNKYLNYRENAKDAHYYLARVPVGTDSDKVMGYVFIDMTLKKAANESVYPELLQPGRAKEALLTNEFSYGIYVNKNLITQTNDYPFPIYLKDDTLKPGTFKSIMTGDYAELWYKVDKEKSVVILHRHSVLLEGITLFSYMLGVLILFALLTLVFRLYFYYIRRENSKGRLIQLTLRKRIHFAMLGVVLISFLIIGGVTIWFFIDRYNESNRVKLQSAMQVLERSIQLYLKDENVTPDEFSFDAETEETKFKYLINNLSSSQSVDINVYNSYGSLKVTSQDDIYNKGILAPVMMPSAYYMLSQQGRTLWIQNEQIGRLNYLSCYVPLRDESGATLGFINVPFFSSEKELNYQISNVLVALINLYAIIFLVSSLLAVFITNWLTRTLQIIIGKFEQFSLRGQNELLEWPYDDEIGLLIREYNRMVKKVEENAILLAQSERERAWREMARQVAHEIKNPLTPMKLNIQYLQQALKSNHPNTKQLTENVSESLIEQIDNLSHIATAFSDFAKMPEADPEEIQLHELLHKAVELYLNNTRTKVELHSADKSLMTYADRSQLLRVFTNLLQNAIEAIPEEREGSVIVSLTREGEHALITVADNGKGIPEEIRESIFNPYFTTKGSGTGLGLAMTKKIIEFWKGKIWFETTEGEGTRFYIQLPLLQAN